MGSLLKIQSAACIVPLYLVFLTPVLCILTLQNKIVKSKVGHFSCQLK